MNRQWRSAGYLFLLAILLCLTGVTPTFSQSPPPEDIIAEAVSAYDGGQLEQAEVLARRAYENALSTPAADAELVVGALTLLGASLTAQGKDATAIEAFGTSLPWLEAQLGTDHPQTLDIISHLAQAYESTGDLPRAAELNARAATGRAKRLGRDHPDTLYSYNNTAVVLDKMGHTAEAVALLDEVVQRSLARLGPNSRDTLGSQVSLALMLDKLTRYPEAELLHSLITPRVAAVFGPADPVTLNQKLNHAINLMIQGRPRDAVPMLQDILRYQPDVFGPSHPTTMTARAILGGALIDLGRADQALDIYAENLRHARTEFGPDHPGILTPLGNYANGLMQLERWPEANAINAERLRIAQKQFSAGNAEIAAIQNDMAGSLAASGRLAEAADLQRRATAGMELALGDGHPMTVMAQVTLAEMLDRIADFPEAEFHHRKAVTGAIAQMASSSHPLVLRASANYASFLLRHGMADEALPLLRDLAHSTENTHGPDSSATAQVNERLASALAQMGRPIEALRHVRRSLAARLAIAKRNKTSDGSVADDRNLALAAWSLSQNITLILKESDDFLADKNMSRSALLDEAFQATQIQGFDIAGQAIRRAAARSAAKESGFGNLLDRWEAVAQMRGEADAALARAAISASSDSNLSDVADTRMKLATELLDLETRIGRLAPAFAEMASPQPVSLQSLRRTHLLGPDDALILLAPAPAPESGSGLVWAITEDGIGFARMPISGAKLSEKVGRYHAMLSQRAGTISSPTRAPIHSAATADTARVLPVDLALAHDLYLDMFGAPTIADLIGDKKTWIIVPQGSLLSLPFAALLTEPPRGVPVTAQSLRGESWLVKTRKIAIVPSVSSLGQLHEAASNPKTDGIAYLGFGDPDFGGGATRFRGIDPDAMRTAQTRWAAARALPRLPATAREIQSLEQAYKPEPVLALVGSDASETSIARLNQDGTLANARIIHFATHGLLSGSLSGLNEPALALSPPADGVVQLDGGLTNDGLLLASEVAQLRLGADWVVLSACDTAAGDRPDAQGLTGLARSFFFAGARALLVTHWAIDDQVAARLVEGTLRNAQGQSTRAAALSDAMKTIMADTSRDGTVLPLSHPSVWAPFQLVGLPE